MSKIRWMSTVTRDARLREGGQPAQDVLAAKADFLRLWRASCSRTRVMPGTRPARRQSEEARPRGRRWLAGRGVDSSTTVEASRSARRIAVSVERLTSSAVRSNDGRPMTGQLALPVVGKSRELGSVDGHRRRLPHVLIVSCGILAGVCRFALSKTAHARPRGGNHALRTPVSPMRRKARFAGLCVPRKGSNQKAVARPTR